MAIFATDDGQGNVTIYGASAYSDGNGNVTLIADEYEEGDVIAEDEISLSLVDTNEIANDVEANRAAIDSIEPRITSSESQIAQFADAISNLIVTEDENGGKVSMMEQTEEGWTFNMSSLLSSVTAAQDATGAVSEDMEKKYAELKENLETFGSYVTIATMDDDTPYIELGNNSDFSVRITNVDMQFCYKNEWLSKMDFEKLFIKTANITEELQIGSLVVKKRGNGNVGFMWKEA